MTRVIPVYDTQWCPETIMDLFNFYHPRAIYEKMEVERVAPSIVQVNNGRWSIRGAAVWETEYPQVNLVDADDGWYYIIGTYRYSPIYVPPIYSYVPYQEPAEFYETHQYSLVFKRVRVENHEVVEMDDVGRYYADPGMVHLVSSIDITKGGSIVERRKVLEDLLKQTAYLWGAYDLFEDEHLIDPSQTSAIFHKDGNYIAARPGQVFQSRALYDDVVEAEYLDCIEVHAEFDTLDSAKYNIYVTNNGGLNWYPVRNGGTFTFPLRAKDLRFRVVFHADVRMLDYIILLKEFTDSDIQDPKSGSASVDTIAPVLKITSPTLSSSYSANSPNLIVAGTASDNVEVVEVSFQTTGATQISGIALGTTNWTLPVVALTEGDTSIVVTARDAAGNTDTKTLQVSWEPSIVPSRFSLYQTNQLVAYQTGVDTGVGISLWDGSNSDPGAYLSESYRTLQRNQNHYVYILESAEAPGADNPPPPLGLARRLITGITTGPQILSESWENASWLPVNFTGMVSSTYVQAYDEGARIELGHITNEIYMVGQLMETFTIHWSNPVYNLIPIAFQIQVPSAGQLLMRYSHALEPTVLSFDSDHLINEPLWLEARTIPPIYLSSPIYNIGLQWRDTANYGASTGYYHVRAFME